MCTQACLDFVHANLQFAEVKGRRVLEVGSRDVNGSARSIVMALQPASYLGVDVIDGPGVDQICDAAELVKVFGAQRFDILISTEMLEHVREWRTVVSQLKQIVKIGGSLIITTRSKGFPYHGFPNDFWRFEPDDIRVVFSDFDVQKLAMDPSSPGVLFKGTKPLGFRENHISTHALYSVVTGRPVLALAEEDLAGFHRRRKRRHLLQTPERALRKIRDRLFSR